MGPTITSTSLKLYNSSARLQKNSTKLNYFSPSIWRQVFLIKVNGGISVKERRVFPKSSVIPNLFNDFEIKVHVGNRFTGSRHINRWMVGFKFGNFTVNRKVAKFKAKQLKKKKKKIRFEHILQIYWTKGLFFAGKLFYVNKPLFTIFSYLRGFGQSFIRKIFARLELNFSLNVLKTDLVNLNLQTRREFVYLFNNLFSQINSVNNAYQDLKKFYIIRLYLIKSYRGWCHALGKPVRGQRTWSNAWSSYKYNKTLRQFISETVRKMSKTKKVEKINYRFVKKKYGVGDKKSSSTAKKNRVWF